MRLRFANKGLESLYETEAGAKRFPAAVVHAFFEVVAAIAAARDERDLYALKSLHYEVLKGERAGQRSMRLNKQYRLIVYVDQDDDGHLMMILDLIDYH